MTNYTITNEWFEDIKNEVSFNNVYAYRENERDFVEADFNEEEFQRVSKEKGWL